MIPGPIWKRSCINLYIKTILAHTVMDMSSHTNTIYRTDRHIN